MEKDKKHVVIYIPNTNHFTLAKNQYISIQINTYQYKSMQLYKNLYKSNCKSSAKSGLQEWLDYTFENKGKAPPKYV